MQKIYREIILDGNKPDLNKNFPANSISSTYYTMETIIPLSLFYQFHNIPYFYFLFIVMLEY